MKQQPPRVALMLDLLWPYKRHASIFFAGTQQYAKENGWISIIDEFVHNTLPAQTGAAVSYDGIIARIRPHPISANLLRSARPPRARPSHQRAQLRHAEATFKYRVATRSAKDIETVVPELWLTLFAARDVVPTGDAS